MKLNGENASPETEQDHRAAMRAATAVALKKIARGAEHELVIWISASEAMAELPPLLDRLLAIGEAAFARNTVEGWKDARRRTLESNAFIRVCELRHAVGARMSYAPTASGDKDEVVEWLMALRNLRATIQPDTLKEPDPADVQYLESLIDGSANLLAEETFARLEPMFIRYAEGTTARTRLETACDACSQAAMAMAKRVLADPATSLTRVIIDAMREARTAAREAASEATDRIRDGIAMCGRAELRLTVERNCWLWNGLLKAAAEPGAERIFRATPSGENEMELVLADLHLPPQGLSVQACAMEAALQVLREHLEVDGRVHRVVD